MPRLQRSRRTITRFVYTLPIGESFELIRICSAEQLAKKYHPDSSKEKGAKEKFVEIQEAYDVSSALCVSPPVAAG
jgi:hypothetical protein